jgi:hypothetical protein
MTLTGISAGIFSLEKVRVASTFRKELIMLFMVFILRGLHSYGQYAAKKPIGWHLGG